MVNSQRNSSPLVMIFLLFSIGVYGLSGGLTDQIASCLIVHNINNFTTFADALNNRSRAYYELLNFSIQNLRLTQSMIPKPIAIILPESVKQLVHTVLCSREGPWEIRVRSGGHTYEGTSFIAADGAPFVIIDMMNLNKVSVDLETKLAWVEGGATLGETYYAIAESSNSHGFTAGSCPTVGIGGHFGGGGFGLLSRKYGLAADHVVDALLIDANGRLLDRETMGEDVFWAIRGGGGGVWGIVYAWKIRLLEVPKIVSGFIVSRPGTKRYIAKLVNKWQHVAPYLADDFYLSCFVGADLPESVTTGISATFRGFYLGPRSKAVSILKEVFPELNIMEEDCTEMSWIESIVFFSGLSNSSSVSDLKNRYLKDKGYFKAKADYVGAPIPFRGIRVALDFLEKQPKGNVILDPYGGIMQIISSESIPFPHREGNLFGIQYLVSWQEEDDSKSPEYIDWVRALYSSMTVFVSSGPRAACSNYMDFDLGVIEVINSSVPVPPKDADPVEIARRWGEKYFLKNYDRLVRAKQCLPKSTRHSSRQFQKE